MVDEDGPAPEQPEFGPGGYLPDRASRRARKIVLRAPLGLQWVIGSLVVGLVVVVAGVLAFGGDAAPEAPFELAVEGVTGAASVTEVALGDTAVLVVTGGRPRAFEAPAGGSPALCDASGLLERPDGALWRTTGRGLAGTTSLVPLPVVLHEGDLWVDPTAPLEPLPADDSTTQPGC